MHAESQFDLRDKVMIDGDNSIVGIVTGFRIHSHVEALVEVSWVHNGEVRAAWIEESRLSK